MAVLHINTGGDRTWIRRVARCPVCKTHHRIVGMSQEWYDIIWTCCGCGDSWAGDELLPRPFKPRWRKEAIAKAKQRWAEDLLGF